MNNNNDRRKIFCTKQYQSQVYRTKEQYNITMSNTMSHSHTHIVPILTAAAPVYPSCLQALSAGVL